MAAKPDPPLRLVPYTPTRLNQTTYPPGTAATPTNAGRARDALQGHQWDFMDLVDILRNAYPQRGGPQPVDNPILKLGQIGEIIRNNQPVADRQTLTMAAQALGDRPVTTMTNPLPNYTPPAMVNTPLAQQLRAMINHALAQRGLSPLINTPLPVGATQMGRM